MRAILFFYNDKKNTRNSKSPMCPLAITYIVPTILLGILS